MINKSTRRICFKLVDEGFTGLDRFLHDNRRSIYCIKGSDDMPVNGGCFWQVIGDVDANTISFGHTEHGTKHCTVVGSRRHCYIT